MFNLMAAQYRMRSVSAQGKASWEDGIKSYLPGAVIHGATGQDTLTGSNLFDVKEVINVNAQDDISFDPSTSAKNFYNLPTVAGQTYTVSFEIKTTGTEAQPNALAISVQDGQNQAYNASDALALLLGVPLDWGRKTIQFTAASEWTSLVTTIVHMRYFQVNAGETALDYEPYCGGIPAPNPSYPIEPKCNSALYAARGKNLVNVPDARIRFENFYYTTTLTSFVLKAGQTYTLSFDYQIHSATQTVGCGLVYYDDSGNRKQLAGDISYPNQTAGRFTGTFTVPESLLFEPAKLMLYLVRMSYAGDADVSISNVMLEFGGTASAYSPYWDGGTVTAPALHGFPGVEACDEWDAVTGQGIRRAHVIALDGTENWVHASDGAYYATGYDPPLASYAETVGYCTHLPYRYSYTLGEGFMVGVYGTFYNYRNDLWPTLAEWKSFLVAQAEAGTPVQVVYVMEEPQSFTFPPQERLSAPAGVGQLVQQGGVISDTNVTVRYLTHS